MTRLSQWPKSCCAAPGPIRPFQKTEERFKSELNVFLDDVFTQSRGKGRL